jgi:hypothetical protein
LKESDKNKAAVLVPLVPTDELKKLPDGASRPDHVIALYAFLLVDRLILRLFNMFILIILSFSVLSHLQVVFGHPDSDW